MRGRNKGNIKTDGRQSTRSRRRCKLNNIKRASDESDGLKRFASRGGWRRREASRRRVIFTLFCFALLYFTLASQPPREAHEFGHQTREACTYSARAAHSSGGWNHVSKNKTKETLERRRWRRRQICFHVSFSIHGRVRATRSATRKATRPSLATRCQHITVNNPKWEARLMISVVLFIYLFTYLPLFVCLVAPGRQTMGFFLLETTRRASRLVYAIIELIFRSILIAI